MGSEARGRTEAPPVVDLRLWRAYLDWLRAYRVIDPTVVPTAALRDAFLAAYSAGLRAGVGGDDGG